MGEKKAYVFVYGTLKKGFHNNVLLQNEEFVAKGLTINEYVLTEDSIPYVSSIEEISRIHGEVYNVSPEAMINLDILEGHPRWYERRLTKIAATDGKVYECWLYFNERSLGALINLSGDFGNRKATRVPISYGEQEVERLETKN
jgi:gamma-glutamylcyclotransferase (GGCT)/AIG2-like uncharacterized protein YtfP